MAPIGPGYGEPYACPAGPLVHRADVQTGRAADTAQRLPSDRVGEGVGAPVVEQYEMEGPRPVAVRRACPGGGVRVHPLRGGGAGQQLQKDLQVLPARHHLLDAHDGDQRLGKGQTHPAVALGLHDDQGAGLGDHEVGAGDPDLRGQELLPQMQPRRLGQLGGGVGQPLGCRTPPTPHLPAEDVADLGAVAVDRGNQKVRGQIVAELHDQLGQIRLVRADAGLGQRLVESDLLRRHRLDLDDLALTGLPHQPGDDPVGLVRVRRPVDLPARGDDRGLQLLQVVVEMAQRTVLHRGARGP